MSIEEKMTFYLNRWCNQVK